MNICEFCIESFTHIQEIMANEKNQEILIYALEDMCNAMAGPVSKSCRLLVDFYVPQIVDLIVNVMDPRSVCVEFELCPSDSFEFPFNYAYTYKLHRIESPVEPTTSGKV